MKSVLILRKIKVEGANAISGLIYGFPAITHFLGYVHAISRELDTKMGITLGGCAVIAHKNQIHSYKNGGGGEQIFSLTRNPLTEDANTSPFNEEGKLHIEISLVIECNFTRDDFKDDVKNFEKLIYQLAIKRRLAGGIITEIASVTFEEIPEDEENIAKQLNRMKRRLLPGAVLLDRSDIFTKYLSENKSLSSVEALLDFYTLKSSAVQPLDTDKSSEVEWNDIPKPCRGWMVPIQLGYKAISPLYEGGKVTRARDSTVPFRFVEPVYGLGEWLWVHRIEDIESIIWNYKHEKDFYICLNKNQKN
ncbi:type I-F CRISPR-associated protein Csy2 [Chlamydiales bacterium]|nr:type I-F CRISPR-associated protein Csy2 [Chlamydiales bacterium]